MAPEEDIPYLTLEEIDFTTTEKKMKHAQKGAGPQSPFSTTKLTPKKNGQEASHSITCCTPQ